MKLSIIVPVYNAEKYLEKCLDSLVNQTMKDYEIILINDGSPDNSQAVMDRYREQYPELIKTRTVQNGGQGRARNIGIEMAQGEYLGFVDSDDWVSTEMYEKMCRLMDEKNADVVCCDIEEQYADGSRRIVKHSGDKKSLLSTGSACDKVFRRSKVGNIRFPEGVWYEDFEFSAKVESIASETGNVPEPLYTYRIGHSSTMNNNNTLKNLDILEVMERLKAFMLEKGLREDFEYILINHILLDSVNRVNYQDTSARKEVIGRLRKYVKENLPSLMNCPSYKKESRNRRIIMALNYYGLTGLSKFILNTKKSISK